MKDIPKSIDPVEFFGFFAKYDDYPTNGYRLAEAAKDRGYSDGLVAFFQGMPGSFENEGDILPLAEDRSKPPFGAAVDADAGANAQVEAPPANDSDALTITDVVQGGPKG